MPRDRTIRIGGTRESSATVDSSIGGSSHSGQVPLNVLLVEANEDGTVGGSHRCLFNLATGLDRDRFRPVVLFYQSNRYVDRLREAGVDVVTWDGVRDRERVSHTGRSVFTRGREFVGAAARRAAFLASRDIDLVHLNNSPLEDYDWLPAARLLGIPCVSHERGHYSRPEGWVRRRVVEGFDRYLAISGHVGSDLTRGGLPAERIRQIYDGIDICGFRSSVTRPRHSVREEAGVSEDEFMVLMVGHLRPWKGQHVAVDAVAELPMELRDRIRLVLVGDVGAAERGYAESLRERIRAAGLDDRVRFLGQRDDVPDLMNAADVVVHASVEPEPFGLVVVEAMSLGKPVVASELGGPAEVITGESGMTFDPSRPEELAAALRDLATSPRLRRRLGEAARRRSGDFSSERNVDEIQAVYDELVDAPPPSDSDGIDRSRVRDRAGHVKSTAVDSHAHARRGTRGADHGSPTRLLLVHDGADWIRGSERCLLDLLTHLDQSRYEPHVWCNSAVLASRVRDIDVPARVSRFEMLFGWEGPKLDVGQYGRTVRAGFRLVRRLGIDLVHSNTAGPLQWMLPIARHARLPLLAHLHAFYNLHDRCVLGLHQSPYTVGVSRAVIENLAREGVPDDRLSVIPNGVDVDRIHRGDPVDLREEFGVPRQSSALVFVGSLIRRKGVDVLLRAMARVEATGDRFSLFIVGDGEERSALEELSRSLDVDGRVFFAGERHDAGAILRGTADVAVVPSREEPFGLTAIEAGACGVPVVASDIPGLGEVIEHGRTGLTFEPGSVDDLADALGELLSRPDLRRQLGRSARRRVDEEYTVERYVRRFEALYDRLRAQPPGRFGWGAGWNASPAYRRLLVQKASSTVVSDGHGDQESCLA